MKSLESSTAVPSPLKEPVWAIKMESLSKTFILRRNHSPSLKSQFVGFFHKRYREERETLWALKDISLEIRRGEVFGFIGRNGSGKSTLLKIISGILEPSSGTIQVQLGARIGTMIELGVGFNPDLTGRENVYLNASLYGMSRSEVDDIFPAVVEFSELERFIDTPLRNYSSGMSARLGFSSAIFINPDILLIDEVLSVGDEAFQKKSAEKMSQIHRSGKTILFVSHSAAAMEEYCDRICLLDQGRVLAVGKPSEVLKEYHKMTGVGV